MKLRSNFTPGTTPWAMRRAQWTALGLTDADLEKPKIAIVSSSSQPASCSSHLDQIAAPLKKAITDARGIARSGSGQAIFLHGRRLADQLAGRVVCGHRKVWSRAVRGDHGLEA